jgi:glycerol-1-phosphate dehydrogenase [NAD(P)+]
MEAKQKKLTQTPSSLMRSIEDLVSLGSGENFLRSSMLRIKDDEFEKILFVTDEKIWKNCRKFFPKNFEKNFAKFLLLKNPQADEKSLEKISKNLKSCDFIVGFGSGTINDLCKFTSAKKNIPYAIFASAASMNGYLSKNASITISGHKKTLPATLPIKVFCDLRILSNAPLELTRAGIGDSLCFYSCWFDWYLSHKVLGTKFDGKIFEIQKPKIDFLIKNYQKFSLKDEKFLKLLIEILLLSGAGMTSAGGSYPASQSEHMIAHTIEMKFPKIAKKLLHGQVIAVTTLTSSNLQKNSSSLTRSVEDLMSLELPRSSKPAVSRMTSVEKELVKFFGKKIAAQCFAEYEEKTSLLKKAKNLNQENWKELKKIHLSETTLKKIFTHFKIKTSTKSIGLSSEQYQACINFAKFTRNRFTCLDF